MHISFADAQSLARNALIQQGADIRIAHSVAAALTLADADGQSAHGLSRIPSYVEQMHCQKVDATAFPLMRKSTHPSIEIDANGGFAFPALELAVDQLHESVRKNGGIAMAAITRSHHCGVAGHPVEKLARGGFLGLMFANTPKAMRAYGGVKAIFGTNPIAFACPRKKSDPIVLDMSLSIAARGKIVQAARQGSEIPDDWGVDRDGEPSADPIDVLNGSLNAIGGAKGTALALMVEILAGALVNSQFGFQATSFFDQQGAPPHVGQLLVCINPQEFNKNFFQQLELFVAEILSEPNVRLPGANRFLKRQIAIESGLQYSDRLIDTIGQYA